MIGFRFGAPPWLMADLPCPPLEKRCPSCHDADMTSPAPGRASRAGGFLLAVSILAGAVIGAMLGQPSIGFLLGTGVGLLLVTWVWLSDRKR